MKRRIKEYFKFFVLYFTVIILVFMAGCTGTSPTAPIINSFLADPVTITAGGSSTLSWNVSDATSVSIDHGVGSSLALSSSAIVSPTTTTTYTLTATNTAGTVTASVQITVSTTPSEPVINSFIADPLTIIAGGSSTLSWNVSDATSVSIDHGVGSSLALSSSAIVSPTTTTTYTLTATNTAGTVTASVQITVSTTPSEPVINSFIADPLTIIAGGSSTLSWNVSDATSVSIDHGVGSSLALSSSAIVSPTTTTTYTLTATNTAGTVTASVQITVSTTPSEPVINSFIADPLTIIAGGSSTLSWNVSDATSVSIDHGVGSSLALSSSAIVSPTTTTTYTLTATNVAGSVTASAQVVVTTAPPAEKPDLVITGINKTETTSGYIISYTIKNQGTADAGTSTTKLYANGAHKASDNVPSVAAGASVDRQFTWIYNPTTPTIKVIADTGNAVDESDEGNNTKQVTFAVEKVYDFVAKATTAKWYGGPSSTSLGFGGDIYDESGFACYRYNIKMEDGITYSKVLETHPKWVDDGWIHGVYTEMYLGGYKVKVGEHFFARVGLLQGASKGNVKFRVMIRPEGEPNTWIAAVNDSYDGKIKTIDVPLQAYVGKKADFVLEVQANGSSAQDWATWVEAKIIR